jgi:phosphatidylethanolamine/phosphatidyl-N-methylethanolamine N-methyltransferase
MMKIVKQNLKEWVFYIKRCIKNPIQLGSIAPSSKETAEFLVKHIKKEEGYVLELGAGTGSFTKALLECGVDAKTLICVEIDPFFCDYLKKRFPDLKVYCGNACELEKVLPKEIQGKVITTVSSIPFLTLSKNAREQIVLSSLSMMPRDGRFIQVSYSPVSPVPWQKLGLTQHRYGLIWKNLPPISIFGYEKI